MKIAYPVILAEDGSFLMASIPDCEIDTQGETLVDVDIEAYRRKYEMRTVRKNLTIPFWLNEEAEKRQVNFSKVLQDALAQLLGFDSSPRV